MAHQVLSFTWLLYEWTPQIFDQPVRIRSIHDLEDAAQPKKGILSRYDGKPFSQNHRFHQMCYFTSKKHIWSAKMVIWPSKHCDFTWFYNQKIEIQLGHIGNHWCMNSRMCILKDKWTLGTWIPEPTQQQFIFGFGGCFPHMRSKPRLRNGEASDKLLYRAHSWSL